MFKVLIVILPMLLCSLIIGGQNNKYLNNCDSNPKFRYIIVSNFVSDKKRSISSSREMLVFFDEKSFSEQNLRTLFNQLSEKYSNPYQLTIRVKTNWDDIPTPDECNRASSSQPDKKDIDDYHWAIFLRHNGNELFRYNPTLKDTNVKTVVLKGNDF